MDARDSVILDGGGRILVVVGDADARAALADVLAGVHRCAGCTAGAEAYVRVRRSRFDVVISEADLVDMAGLDLLDMLRGLRDAPDVVLTASQPSPDWVRHAFKRGAYDVLSVSPDPEEIRSIVANAIARRSARHGRSNTPSDACPTIEIPTGHLLSGRSAREGFAASLEHLRAVCRHHNKPASVLVMDIDDPDSDNVANHHTNRHQRLAWISRSLDGVSSAVETTARLDPHCIVLALRDTDENEAADVADRIRRTVCSRTPHRCDKEAGMRLRIGVASTQPGFIETGEDLIERAKAASERAKELGGNQTIRWSQVSSLGPSRRQLESASVDEVSGWISRSRQQLRRGYMESTMALVAAVEAKEPHTHEHARVVSRYCEEIGRRMELPAGRIDALRTAALLHDIGKIGVPDAILQKPGPLTEHEFEIVKRHPLTAVDILGHASFLQTELPYILHHHERYDGGGYPAGLKGDEIPLGARIVSVADSLDAMLSTRCYKRGLSPEQVTDELTRCAGTQFDPEVARVAREWLTQDARAAVVR